MTTYEYENLQITGKVSVTAESHISWDCLLKTVAVMGPKGAGKSAERVFIEALCGDASLGISRDQLESYTQDVSAYRLVNVNFQRTVTHPIYVVGTPGFADRKISDTEIVFKLHKWLKQYGKQIEWILYLIPITDIRLSGSKRRTLQTFKEITGIGAAKDVTIVTTMWDTVGSEEGMRQAELRFEELKNGP